MFFMKILIAGASGFIGKNLIKYYAASKEHEIIALSRSQHLKNLCKNFLNVTCLSCDVFSFNDIKAALKNVDVAFYLIHSMLPKNIVSHGSFEDFDFLLADNFAKAAKSNKLKKIIYISGMLPRNEVLSSHLKSRLEVEKVLDSSGVPVITLRAAMVVGPNGSSFSILKKLVERLPFMLCPRWTETKTQPIFIDDLITIMDRALHTPSHKSMSIDVGGPDVLSYNEMLKVVAHALDLKRHILHVPLKTVELSKLWIRLVTQAPKLFIYPLIESLKCDMVVNKPKEQELFIEKKKLTSFTDSVKFSIKSHKKVETFMLRTLLKRFLSLFSFCRVSSVERFDHKSNKDVVFFSQTYFKWLEKFSRGFIRVTCHGDFYEIRFVGINLLTFKFLKEETLSFRQVFLVVGGLLTRKKNSPGRLEFRKSYQNTFFIVIENYQPSLLKFIYIFTQWPLHSFIMRIFKSYLLTLKE